MAEKQTLQMAALDENSLFSNTTPATVNCLLT